MPWLGDCHELPLGVPNCLAKSVPNARLDPTATELRDPRGDNLSCEVGGLQGERVTR